MPDVVPFSIHRSSGIVSAIGFTGIDNYGTTGTPDFRDIYMGYRSNNADFDNQRMKFFRRLDIIGDKLATSANLQIRHSDDDFSTFSEYRTVDLSAKRPVLRNMGSSRRRGWEFLFIDAQDWRWKEIELEFEIGCG